jgi:hypothetical protein
VKCTDLVKLLYRHAVDMGLPVKDSWWTEPPVDARPLDLFDRIAVSSDTYIAVSGVGPAPGPVTWADDVGFPVNMGAVPAPTVGGTWDAQWYGFVIDAAGDGYSMLINSPGLAQNQRILMVRFNPDTGGILATSELNPAVYVGPVLGGLNPSRMSGLAIDRTTNTLHFSYMILNINPPGVGSGEMYLAEISTAFGAPTFVYIGYAAAGTPHANELGGGPALDTNAGTLWFHETDSVAAVNKLVERNIASAGGAIVNQQNLAGGVVIITSPVYDAVNDEIHYSDTIAAQQRWLIAPATFPVVSFQNFNGTELGNPVVLFQSAANGFTRDGYVFRNGTTGLSMWVYDPTTNTLRSDSRNDAITERGQFMAVRPSDGKVYEFWSVVGPPFTEIRRYTVTYPTVAIGGGFQQLLADANHVALSIWGVITHLSLTPVPPAASSDPVMIFDDGKREQLGEFPGGNNEPLLAVGPNEYRSLFNDDFNQPIKVRLAAPIIIPDSRQFRILVRKFNAAVANFDCVATAHGWYVPEPDEGRR